jgi:hypothetical protein
MSRFSVCKLVFQTIATRILIATYCISADDFFQGETRTSQRAYLHLEWNVIQNQYSNIINMLDGETIQAAHRPAGKYNRGSV